MAEYKGANTQGSMEGNLKEAYPDKKKSPFKKIKKKLC